VIGGEIGRGGMAAVYTATAEDGGATCALKRPMPWEGCDERLRREAEVLARFDNPHLMNVVDQGQDDEGWHWYAMPLALGRLDRLWEAGQLGSDREAVAREILVQVGDGLRVLHGAGYLHRDLKPANVLAMSDAASAERRRWVLADFGLVRRPVGETTDPLTGSASVLGTLGNIAPEVHGNPHNATAAADIYASGAFWRSC
jgi:serine/threonine protein kinase